MKCEHSVCGNKRKNTYQIKNHEESQGGYVYQK